MLKVTPLSQRDPRWGEKYLGFSKRKIKSFGCTLVSLTMLLNYVEGKTYRVDDVNERLKAVKAFTGALIIWYRVPLAFPKLKWVKRAYNYSNADVAWNIYVKKLPVMVEVNAASIGAARHWVLFIGGGKMNDPWTGREQSTGKYPTTGYSVYHRA